MKHKFIVKGGVEECSVCKTLFAYNEMKKINIYHYNGLIKGWTTKEYNCIYILIFMVVNKIKGFFKRK
jgi:hypothetical protein